MLMKETETASGLGGGGSPGLSYAILGFIPALALGQSEGKKKKKKDGTFLSVRLKLLR